MKRLPVGNVPMKDHSTTNIIQLANDSGIFLYLDGNVRPRHKIYIYVCIHM